MVGKYVSFPENMFAQRHEVQGVADSIRTTRSVAIAQ